MNKEKYIWEDDRFQKNPFKVPEGYFESFPDRMMDRLAQSVPVKSMENRRLMRPWMVWVSGIAAVMVFGWFGFHSFYLKPLQEVRFQENIALFVDYCGEELHEGQLAGFIEENKIELKKQASTDATGLIQVDPNLAEEYIYESVGL